MRALTLLNLRRARRQPLRLVIAVVAIAGGVGLAGSVLVVDSSLRRSFEDFARSFSGPAPLRVVGPASRGGLDESVIPIVERAQGVRAAVPVVQAVTFANPPSGEEIAIVALGFDCRIEALIGDIGCTPDSLAVAGEESPVISRSLRRALGTDGVIRTNLGSRPVRTSIPAAALDDVNGGRVVAYPLPVAQELFTRPEALDAIYVLPERGVEAEAFRHRLQSLVGGHNGVLERTEVRADLTVFFDTLVPFLGLISLFALAVGAVLVHNTFALSLAERRRDLALAGALGATRRTLVTGALLEAGLLGLVGGIAGAGAALLLARPILGGMQWFAERISGLELHVHATPLPFVVGIVLGATTAILAAIAPARRAARLDVVAELQNRERTTTPGGRRSARPLVLTAVGGGALGLAWWIGRGSGLRPSDPIVGQLAFVVAAVALSWAIASAAPWIFAAASRLFGRRSVPARLGWANLVREPRRASVLLIAATLAVGLGFAISSIVRMVGDGIGAAVEQEIGDDLSATTTPRSNSINLDARPSPELQEALRNFPGVRSVTRGVGFAVGTTPSQALGVEGMEHSRLPYEMIARRLDPAEFERGAVLIGPTLARERGLGPGSVLRLPGRTGFESVRVLGVWANGDFNGREVWMPMWLLERIYGPQPPLVLGIERDPGVGAAELAGRIEAARLDPFLTVRTREQVSADIAEESARFAQPFWALQRGMMVVAFAAVLFTLLLVAVQRRRELGLVAAVGMPPGGFARMVLMEALAVGVIGTVCGTLFGLAFIQAFRDVGFLIVPFRFPYRIDVFAAVLYGALTTVLLLAAAALPAFRHSRLQVVDAIRYE